MKSVSSLSLDLSAPNIAAVAYAVQNDRSARHVVAQLCDGSATWTPPAGAAPVIRYVKPDGTGGFYDADDNNDPAIVISGSKADMTIVEQALTVPGDVYMQLHFYAADGTRLTSFAWILRVQKSVLEDATIISSDYYNVLSAQIAAVLNAAAAITGLTASVTGLPTGSDPTVNVTGGTGGVPYNLAFGLPAGPVGPPEIPTSQIRYQAGTSPTTPPTGTWQTTPPSVPAGGYLWTRTVLTYSSGATATIYAVARQGIDGNGAPGTLTPLMDGTAAVGTSTNFARQDHVHPTDASRAAAADLDAKIIATQTAFAIPAEGASVSYDMPGMTEDHQLTRWNFSDSAENAPPVDLTWTTYAGYFTITNTSGTTAETMQPMFAIPTGKAISTH
jgi:hypothetical protein